MNISRSTQKTQNKKSDVFNSVSYNRIEDNLYAEQENIYNETELKSSSESISMPVAPPLAMPAPTAEAPAIQRPAAPPPVAPAPAVEAPVIQRPVAPPPVAPASAVEEPVAPAPVVTKSATKEPIAHEPEIEQPIRKVAVRRTPVKRELAEREPARREPLPEKPDSNVKKEPKTISPKMKLELYDWLQCIVTAIICGVLIFIFVGRTIGVHGSSMNQTLRHNDRVVISNLFYTPDNGDIVVFRSSSERFEHPLVKRVIAIAGQTVDINTDAGNVFVDGILLDEPFVNTPTNARHDFTGPVFVPAGYVFVLGDNRNSSTDSRDNDVGLVDTRYILGNVLFVLIPGQDQEGQRDWSRFGAIS